MSGAKGVMTQNIEKQAYADISAALKDALNATRELEDEFKGDAARAFFESRAVFEARVAQPLIKAADALSGEGGA